MILSHHAYIALDPQRLPPDAFGQVRERAHGEIDRTGLEPRVEMLCVKLHGAEPHVRRLILSRLTRGGRSLITEMFRNLAVSIIQQVRFEAKNPYAVAFIDSPGRLARLRKLKTPFS